MNSSAETTVCLHIKGVVNLRPPSYFAFPASQSEPETHAGNPSGTTPSRIGASQIDRGQATGSRRPSHLAIFSMRVISSPVAPFSSSKRTLSPTAMPSSIALSLTRKNMVIGGQSSAGMASWLILTLPCSGRVCSTTPTADTVDACAVSAAASRIGATAPSGAAYAIPATPAPIIPNRPNPSMLFLIMIAFPLYVALLKPARALPHVYLDTALDARPHNDWRQSSKFPVPARVNNRKSKPEAQSRDKLRILGVFTCGTYEIRRPPELACPFDSDIGSNLTREFITQTQTSGRVGEATTDISRRVLLSIQIHFDARLQDELLRQQHFVLSTQAQRGPSAVYRIGGCIDVEPVGRQPLNAERQPATVLPHATVPARAELRIPERGHRMPPERFGAGILQTAPRDVALGLEHQAIVIAAKPGLRVIGR